MNEKDHVKTTKNKTENAPVGENNGIELKPASIGSVSHGTLRTEDLLSAFISELEWHAGRNGALFAMPENFAERDRLANIIATSQDCFDFDGDGIDAEKEDIAEELVNETMPDALQAFAPAYCYFGAHCGDGADFGFWPCMEQIDELPCYESKDDAKEAGETGDFRVVSDHGNVDVYSLDGKHIIGIV